MQSIKKLYLYLVSVITLVIMVIGGIILLHIALKAWVFTKADNDFYVDYGRCVANHPAQDQNGVIKAVPVGLNEKDNCTEEEMNRLMQEAKDNRNAQRQRDASQALAMLLVATPVWYFHWRLAKQEA